MITLQKFNGNDFARLIAEVPDARFLLQWSGPKYVYPLDDAQLQATVELSTGDQPSFRVSKAVLSGALETAGHIQLMNIDYKSATCTLGRVLIFKAYRGKGLGKELVALAVKEAFENLNLNEILLSVFDFNTKAIATYKSIGFVEYQFEPGARPFQDEKWNVIKMKLHKDRYAALS
ncbi:MAG: GNAT family N-acetyltransferase [Proteobacteria bacterium]|nr:GNAT family N-acetyltransferase [Pseudomonadota bacterium]MBU4470985.1 GNAT family N-acetyltransferase [Pseudomonadota bacterium]MCG2753585.1 GNAT family N-acetyltransferase [Desulfobacteraceae bacterium]